MAPIIGVVTNTGIRASTRNIQPLTDQHGKAILDPVKSDFGGELYLAHGEGFEVGELVIVDSYRLSGKNLVQSFKYSVDQIRCLSDGMVPLVHVTDTELEELVKCNGQYSFIGMKWPGKLAERAIWKTADYLYGPFRWEQDHQDTHFSSENSHYVYRLDVTAVAESIKLFEFLDTDGYFRSVVTKEDYQSLVDLLSAKGIRYLTISWTTIQDTLIVQPSDQLISFLAEVPELQQTIETRVKDRLLESYIEPELAKIMAERSEHEKRVKEFEGRILFADEVLMLREIDEEDAQISNVAEGKWKDEKEFLQHVQNYIAGKGYIFDSKLIANFWTCLKNDYLTILAGISGTGKSKLPQLFAEAIGAVPRLIPVKPNWHDSRDLLGFYNPLLLQYQTTPLLEALLSASQEQESRIWIIILDELNLAPVEHYLADFLSLLEQDGSPSLELDGWGIKTWRQTIRHWEQKADPTEYHSAERLKPPVKIPDNVRFVGTVNVDHTTHSLSDKVLDRSNVIQFEDVDLAELTLARRLFGNGAKAAVAPRLLSRLQYLDFCDLSAIRESDVLKLSKYEEKIREIEGILRKSGLNFGFRVQIEIENYLLQILRGNQYLPLEEAFDMQLLQRVLPKIRGVDSGNGVLIKTLKELKAATEEYQKTNRKVDRMIKQIGQGYVNYWETR